MFAHKKNSNERETTLTFCILLTACVSNVLDKRNKYITAVILYLSKYDKYICADY